MPLKHTILLLLGVLSAIGCSHKTEPKSINRLDLAIADGTMTAADSAAFSAWAEIIDFNGSPDDYNTLTNLFADLTNNATVRLDSVEMVLGHALADKPELKITAVISPYNQAVVTHPDGYVFVALNHYLGEQSPAYAGFAEFIRRRKVNSRMPIDIVMAIVASENEPQFANDATLLNHLLYQGALLLQTRKLLPEGTSEAALLGMTPEEYEWCKANEPQIWKALIERKLLYSTDYEVINRLMRPAPGSPLISANAPGQAVLYCALKLAEAYERNTGNSALPQPEFYNNPQSLIKAAYAPL